MFFDRSTTPFNAVEISPRGNGTVDVWLSRNINSVTDTHDGEEYTAYTAERVHFIMDGEPTVETIQGAFETLWADAERENLQDAERIKALESELLNTQEALAEVYESIVLGGV